MQLGDSFRESTRANQEPCLTSFLARQLVRTRVKRDGRCFSWHETQLWMAQGGAVKRLCLVFLHAIKGSFGKPVSNTLNSLIEQWGNTLLLSARYRDIHPVRIHAFAVH